MEIIQDVIITNTKVLKRSIEAVKKNPIVIILGVIYTLVWAMIAIFAMNLGFLGSIVLTLASAAMGSHILYVIERVLGNNKLNLQYWQDGIRAHFRPVILFMFLYNLVNYAITLFIFPIFSAMGLGMALSMIVQFLIFIFFNPLPETIYHTYAHESVILEKSFKFVIDNKFAWFIPNILVSGVLYLFYRALGSIFGSLPYAIGFVLTSLILSGFIAFFMIYRGYLYDMLNTTSRRKRLFMRHMS